MYVRTLAVVFGCLMALPVSAGFIVIDDFVTAHEAMVTTNINLPQSAGSVANPTQTALGVERDLWVTKTLGAQGAGIRAQVNPFGENRLLHSQDSGVRGSTRVTWDGIDGDPNGIDFDGLGGLDFGLAAAGFFEIGVSFNDLAGPIDIVVYDASDPTGARNASGTINVPGGIDDLVNPTIFQLSFANMTLNGGATTDLFRSVGAITLTINGTAQGGRDTDLTLYRAFIETPVPAPGVLPLFASGLIGLVSIAKRRK